MKSVYSFVVLLSSLATVCTYTVVPQWDGSTVEDLHREYSNIFKHGNRNAASHLWSSFILQRSRQMTRHRLQTMFSGFCAVSGSPVGPHDYNRYRLTLQTVTGAKHTGFMHYCCWPCVCDTQDFLKVDTLNVTLAGQGPVQMHFIVIGNPCDRPEQLDVPFVHPFNYGGGETTIARDAAEVRCGSRGELLGATLSDHGYPIVSLFFDAPGAAGRPTPVDRPTPGRVTTSGGITFHDEQEYAGECASRAAAGYNSGMGEIFRKVAAVSPIMPGPGGRAGALPPAKGLMAQRNYTETELSAERVGSLKRIIRDYGGNCLGCNEKAEFVAKVLALQKAACAAGQK